MKKTHLALLIIASIMTVLSVYSLAAMNQVYKLDFQWYSQYSQDFSDELRDTSRDEWSLEDYPAGMKFGVVGNSRDLAVSSNTPGISLDMFSNIDFGKYVLLYFTFGEVTYPEYRARITDIAQRGGVVEVVVSLNSPQKGIDTGSGRMKHDVTDTILIRKSSFFTRGKLLFIFKNQDGQYIGETSCDVK